MEKNDDIKSKCIALYRFVLEFCKSKDKVILDEKDYDWILKISDIPNDNDNIMINYNDYITQDNESEDNDYIIKVHKPEFEKCPEPPNELVEWIYGDWDYYKNEVKVREKVTREGNFELLEDDSNRINELKEWNLLRDSWVSKQQKIEKTRHLFSELYSKYVDLKRDSETMEIVVGNGCLKDKNNPSINHPCITKRVDIKFDAETNTIYVKNTDSRTELYVELFQNMKDINLELMPSLTEEIINNDYDPIDRIETKKYLKKLLYKISPDSKFIEVKEEIYDKDCRILMYFEPKLIIRKRKDGTIKAIEQIISNIEETGDVPKHLRDIVGGNVLERKEEKFDSIEDLLATANGESNDILLTKDANKEQLEIAKRMNYYNAVLVQGPPGTGKTHTIANLVGHFLAQGKNILVTSYTKKALSVLKEKIPESMQNLCVSVLDDDKKDMEKSIEGIIDYMSKYSSVELENKIKKLKEKRNQIINELTSTRKKIFNVVNLEYKSIEIDGEVYSPVDIACFINKNKGRYDFFQDRVDINEPFPLTIEELAYLYSTNSQISFCEEKELNYLLPSPEELISPFDFSNSSLEIEELKKQMISLANSKKWKIVIKDNLYFETDFGNFHIDEFNFENISKLKEYLNAHMLFCKKSWAIKACSDGKKEGAYKNRWLTFFEKIREASKLNEEITQNYFEKKYTGDIDCLVKVKKTVIKLYNILKRRNKISKCILVIHKDINSLLQLKIINNNTIKTMFDCEFLIKTCELYELRNTLNDMWNELMSEDGKNNFYSLDENNPEIVAEKYINEIEYYLNWFSNEYENFVTLLNKCGIPTDIVLNINKFDKDIEQVKKLFLIIEDFIPSIVECCLYKCEINQLESEIKKSIIDLSNYKLKDSRLCINMINSLNNLDVDTYKKDFDTLERLYKKNEILRKRNELIEKINKVAPIWANLIKTRVGIHARDKYPSEIMEAWKYSKFYNILKGFASEPLIELQKNRKRIESEYKKITEMYAENLAWYELLKRVEYDVNMKHSLVGWELTTKKIGKNSKNSAKNKAEARKLMSQCQMAVPCWIMTINKALETLKPGKNIFDIVIIDEASQADISALAMTYLGKQIIVVGDDKQVSPLSIGVELDKINNLEQIYIKNRIPNSHLYGSNTSLYDIAKTTFQPIMLKEHFRCVPEIIGFSNMLSYDYKIKPLRDSSSSNLFPSIVNYRVFGKRLDNKTNLEEAKIIIALLKSCIEMEEYKEKTFGIISLLGKEQVGLINKLLQLYLDPKTIEMRKIIVGDASNFQGDERDVIFLTLVDSSSSNGPLKKLGYGFDDLYKKRYNVATSRARDQLWIINSLDPSYDLKQGDIRKLLLDYANNPNAFEFERKKIENQSDSFFEVEVASKLNVLGYNIVQQYPVGSYRLDIVVKYKNKKVAIECDGDRYHSGEEKVREDMERQTILERIGWKFIRVRGSVYFLDPDREIKKIIEQLQNFEIFPEEKYVKKVEQTNELLDKIKNRAKKIYKEIHDKEDYSINSEDILFALDSKNRTENDNLKNINELINLDNTAKSNFDNVQTKNIKHKKTVKEFKMAEILDAKSNNLMEELIKNNFNCIDNREKSEIIWVLYDKDKVDTLSSIMSMYDYEFILEKRGSIITKNIAAWRIMCKKK